MTDCPALQRLKCAANVATARYCALLDEGERLQTVTGLQKEAVLDLFFEALVASQTALAACHNHVKAHGCGAIEAERAASLTPESALSRG